MAVTLEGLRSKCVVELQEFSPGVLMPNIDGEIRRSVAETIKRIGGIPATATFYTTAGTREVDSNTSGFPTRVFRTRAVYRGANQEVKLRIIQKVDRYENSSGDPHAYYLENKKMGFDVTPSSVVLITWDYFSLENDFTDDDDEVLSSWPQKVDDDPFWDAIVFDVAEIFHRRRYARDGQGYDQMRLYRNLKLKARYNILREFQLMNADEAFEPPLPDYFTGQTRGQGSLRRFGRSGDTIIIN